MRKARLSELDANACLIDKDLLAARLLGGAASRHNSCAKQSGTEVGVKPDAVGARYVEPNPHLYARLARSLFLQNGLQNRNLLFTNRDEPESIAPLAK
jgi:hypothetical protein